MAIRLSGMISGMDTESIISELVKAKSVKKTELEGEQKKLSWKQEKWKELNSKVYAFYSKTLSNMRLTSDFNKKMTTSSNSTVSIVTGSDAPNCVQTMTIDKMAKAGYLTGAQLSEDAGTYTSDTKVMEAFGIKDGSSFTITSGGTSKEIKITESTTIGNIITEMRKAGVNANFDETNQRFYISAKNTGKKNDFTITANGTDGLNAMSKLGIAASLDDDKTTKELYEKYADKLVYDASGNLDKAASIANLQAMIDEAVANDIKSNDYATKIKDAETKIDELTDKLTAAQTEYQSKFLATDDDGVTPLYLTTTVDGGNPVAVTDVDTIQTAVDNVSAEVQTAKEALEGLAVDMSDDLTDEEIANLTEEQKTAYDTYKAKEAQYDNYLEQLGSAKDLAKIQEDIDAQQKIVDDAKVYYTPGVDGAEGTATQALKDKIADEQYALAQEYKAMLDIYKSSAASSMNAIRIAGQDARIFLNDALYTSERNVFEINDLTITVNNYTADEITLSTSEDTSGIYDMVKNFFKEYNELINEMDKLYNADSASKYTMLTDEEREALSEDEVKEWDDKIKSALLRRDSNLSTLFESMKTIMLSGVEMSNGTKMYLSNFGIGTAGYFTAAENERNAYHIDGDEDDSVSGTNTDKLKAAIASNPEQVSEFFAKLARNMYDKLDDLMKSTDYSSAFTVYDDKSLKEEYDNYKEKIADQEEKIAAFEDRYYDKFAAMEVAMSKLNSQQSSLSSLFGM